MSNELRRSNSFFDLLSDTGPLFQNRFFQEIKMDVRETEDNYQVTADLPGYAKEDITVDYENRKKSTKMKKAKSSAKNVLRVPSTGKFI